MWWLTASCLNISEIKLSTREVVFIIYTSVLPKGKLAPYWSYSGGNGDWADDAMTAIGDNHARYYDGRSGGLWKGIHNMKLFQK